jgi:hypothetical protein
VIEGARRGSGCTVGIVECSQDGKVKAPELRGLASGALACLREARNPTFDGSRWTKHQQTVLGAVMHVEDDVDRSRRRREERS